VQPYYDAPGRYLKPTGFQIISAGPDGKFGNVGLRLPALGLSGWSPVNASNVWPSGTDGHDDLSNFYDSALGTSQ
jgi:hypothetical protein